MTKPSSRGSRSRRKGGVPRSLTQSQIVEAALELTRVNGLDGLTMNALATRLGVGVMTIYSYYRGRDELLDAMADRAAAELYDNHRDSIDQPWDVELRAHYRALRESLRSHPSLAISFSFADKYWPPTLTSSIGSPSTCTATLRP